MHWLSFDFGVNLSNICMNSCIREFYHIGDTRECTGIYFSLPDFLKRTGYLPI